MSELLHKFDVKFYIYTMNWLQKTITIIGLSIIIFFASNAKQSCGPSIEIQKSHSSLSPDTIHTSVFIQPQISNVFISHHNSSNSSVVKYFENFLIAIPDLKTKVIFNRFANQDINRCEKVSLLLFPYHSFW